MKVYEYEHGKISIIMTSNSNTLSFINNDVLIKSKASYNIARLLCKFKYDLYPSIYSMLALTCHLYHSICLCKVFIS